MPVEYSKKRREPRYPIIKQVTYTSGDSNRGDVSDGLIVNISTSGLCLYVYRPLETGEIIIINDNLPTSCQKFVSCWSKKIEDDLYVAGFHCSASKDI